MDRTLGSMDEGKLCRKIVKMGVEGSRPREEMKDNQGYEKVSKRQESIQKMDK